jgi:cell division protease FtsH
MIDAEISSLINTAHQEAFDALVENREILDELVRQLLDQETLGKEQVAEIFTDLVMRPARPPWTGSPTRQPSTVPPIPAPEVPEPVLEDQPTREDGSVEAPATGSVPANPMGPGTWIDPEPTDDFPPPKP